MTVSTFYCTSTLASGSWTNPTNAYAAPNGVLATTTTSADALKLGGLGIDAVVPSTAWINSVTLNYRYTLTESRNSYSHSIWGYVGGSIVGGPITNTGESGATSGGGNGTLATVSGTVDITAAQLRDANFALQVSCTRTGTRAFTFSLDSMWIDVDWIPGDEQADDPHVTIAWTDDLHMRSSASTRNAAVKAAISTFNPDQFWVAGDILESAATDYQGGGTWDYNTVYGSLNSIAYWVPGNHDFDVNPGATPGFDTYHIANCAGGALQSAQGHRYYAQTITADGTPWRVYHLSNGVIDGSQYADAVSVGSAQYNWLQADLADHPNQPIVAVFHVPRWSAFTTHPTSEGDTYAAPLYDLLYDAGADVVCSGHVHGYARWPEMNKSGVADPGRGIVQITGPTSSEYGNGDYSAASPPTPSGGADPIFYRTNSSDYNAQIGYVELRLYKTHWSAFYHVTPDTGGDTIVDRFFTDTHNVYSDIPSGTGTGSWAFAGTAAGVRAPKGSATGTWTFTGTTAAKTLHSGAGTGNFSFAGAASGAVPKHGSATGSWSFTGTAVGSRPAKGSGSGRFAWGSLLDPDSSSAEYGRIGAWTVGGSAPPTITSSLDQAHGGADGMGVRSLKTVWQASADTGNYIRLPITGLTIGATYTLVVWHRYFSNPTMTLGFAGSSATLSSPSNWTQTTLSITASQTSHDIQINPTGTVSFAWTYLDDLELWPGSGQAIGVAPEVSVPTGSATGSWDFSGTAVGARTTQATATGSWFFTGSAAGARTPKASGSGSWSFAGSATGSRTPKGSGSGSWSFAGSAAGARTPKATSTGSWSFAGVATGARAPQATASGTWSYAGSASSAAFRSGEATGSWSLAGAAVGARTPKGTCSGSWSYSGVAVGQKAPVGSATGQFSFTGTAAGLSHEQGEASGTLSYVGAAQGRWAIRGPWSEVVRQTTTSTVANEGSATGDWSFTGTAVGSRPAGGASTGSWSFSGTAVGAKAPQGSASGSWSFTGAATAVSTPQGSATGTWAWVGSAAGQKVSQGTASGTWTFAGAAAGLTQHRGSGSGSFSYAGAAAGSTERRGAATGSWQFSGLAYTTSAAVGHASGATAWVGVAAGAVQAKQGTAAGSWTWTGTASGKRVAKATVAGTWSWVGVAIGRTQHRGSATAGAWSFSGAAQGWVYAKHGSGVGTWSYAGAAVGKRIPKGNKTSTWSYVGVAVGRIVHKGAATGSWAWVGLAEGASPAEPMAYGSADGLWSFTGTAAGITLRTGAASGSWVYYGRAGRIIPEGQAAGTWSWTILTPDGRIWHIAAAVRLINVSRETRVFVIQPELRLASARPDSRVMLIAAESRTFVIPREDRVLLAPALIGAAP